MADGIIEPDEQDDLLWLCQNFTTENIYFDSLTSEIQILQGILHGILADGKITEEEAEGLQRWLWENEHLKGTYPFDEIDSLLMSILADKIIDPEEHELLKTFFENFVDYSTRRKVSEGVRLAKDFTLPGICAACPDLTFEGRTFTLTGSSYKGTRREIVEKLEAFGAAFSPSVTNRTDYLVICSAGNPCWAFSCYGRKVERAVGMRKEGHPIIIVHESDFWDAMEDS